MVLSLQFGVGKITLNENEDEQYRRLVKLLRDELAFDLPVVVVEKQHLPNFMFLRAQVVVVLGQDGLVANTAKYALDRPIIGVNPDPQRIDGNLQESDELVIESLMPERGVIFSDGIEDDYLEFNSGSIARISVATKRAKLAISE